MQLYFIRHGQSGNNLLWQETRSNKGRSDDPELTVTGIRQAEVLAQFLCQPASSADAGDDDGQNLAGFGITHLYCSLMVRAAATGTAVAHALDLPLVAWPDLHEGGGIWLEDEQTGERVGREGKNRAYFEACYPHLVLPSSLDDVGWWSRPFEPYEDRPVRAQRLLRDLLDRHAGTQDRVAVISHGGFYNYFMWVLLGMPEREGYWFALNNTGITRINFQPNRVGLVYSNRVDFLPSELIT